MAAVNQFKENQGLGSPRSNSFSEGVFWSCKKWDERSRAIFVIVVVVVVVVTRL